MRSMGSGFTVKLLGSLAVACVFAASEPELFGLAAHAPSHVNYVYAAPWIVAALLFGGAAWGLAKDSVSDAQTRQNVRAMDLGLPFALLLRPFNFDGSIMVANPHKSRVLLFPSYWSEDATIPFERLVAQGIQPNLQLRALGGKPVGPGVLLVHDKDWRSRFHELAPAAKGILLIALPGREISWELAQLREHGLLEKTVVFVPSPCSVILSAGGHRFQKTADVQIVLLKFWAQCRAMGFDLPVPGSRPAFVYLDHAGRTVDKATPRKLNYRSLRAALSRRWDIPTQTVSVPLQGQLQGEAVPYDEHLTELMFYAARGDLDQIKTLVAAGNEVNARSVSGYTALMYAARNNHADVASFLLSSGADPSLESSKGSSAAAIAARHGHTKLAALLERRTVRKMRLRRL